jgi:hypothetical protein
MTTSLLKFIPLVAVCVMLGACATPYQPNGIRGGYKDQHLHDNVYYVAFGGNAWIDKGTAVQYFHRRAKELCTEKGFGNYRVLKESDSSQWQGVAGYGTASVYEKPVWGGEIECVG